MSAKVLRRITSTLIAFSALCAVLAPSAMADEYYDRGVVLFKKGQYGEARRYFDKACENAPWDSNAFYYQALTAQYQKDWKNCKEMWGKIIDRFPGTPAAANATAVMKTLDPGYFKRAKGPAVDLGPVGGAIPAVGGGAASGGDSNAEALIAKAVFTSPAQVRVPVTRVENRVFMDAQINNRSLKIEFDGSTTAVNPKDAAALGITNPDRTPVKKGSRIPVSVRLGDVAARNFPILIEDTERSHIGDDFFRTFSYQLDPTVLVLTKKAGSTASRSSYDVPFRKQGADMVVEVTMNGRRCNMVFDQAGGEAVVPRKRAREFGLDIEESSSMDMFDVNKQSGPLRGEAGFGEVKVKSVAEAKISIGPVANQVMQVKVDDNVKEPKLGGSALSGWKFSVDPAANLIRFSR
jgi:hypothetical protein